MNKFRVYDKQEKKLYKPDTMGELFHLFALTMDGRLGRFNEDLDKYETCDPDRYVVEFSTGLKDKNGVEIYEGDILGCHGVRYYISLQAGRAFELRGENCKEDCVYFLFYHHKILKIIGNKHDGEAYGKD